MDKKQDNLENTDREVHEHEIYEQNLDDDPNASFGKCRNCKREIRKKLRRCPYCGILNPTVTVKEIVVTMLIMTIIFYIFAAISV